MLALDIVVAAVEVEVSAGQAGEEVGGWQFVGEHVVLAEVEVIDSDAGADQIASELVGLEVKRFQGQFRLFLVAHADGTRACLWVQQGKKHDPASLLLEALLDALNCAYIACLVCEFALLPQIVRVGLQEVKGQSQFLTFGVRSEKMLIITQRAAKITVFVVRNQEYCGIATLISFSQESNSTITEKYDPDSNFIFELVTFEDALKT